MYVLIEVDDEVSWRCRCVWATQATAKDGASVTSQQEVRGHLIIRPNHIPQPRPQSTSSKIGHLGNGKQRIEVAI